MQKRKLFIGLLLVFVLILSACSSGSDASSGDVTTQEEAPAEEIMQDAAPDEMVEEENSDEMMEDEKPDEMVEDEKSAEMNGESDPSEMNETGETDEMGMESPDWYSYPFTDVTTGETFTIDELKGKVILVETMAMWCTNCKRQQQEVIVLHDNLGDRDDFVSLGLDIDHNEDAEALKGFVASNNFHWLYAIAPPEVSREIGNLYGNQFLNPPSTPMFIIDRHGEVHPLPFGGKRAADLQEALQPFLEESM